MSEFKAIETQEAFDEAIKERLSRAERSAEEKYKGFLSPEEVEKKYSGYLSPEQVEKQYKGFLSPEEAEKKDAAIKRYETDSAKTRIALENGLPYEMASRLSGETEEDIKKDAESFAKLMKLQKGAPPMKSSEAPVESKKAAMKKMLSDLKGE